MHSLGWGIGGDAWVWRRQLRVWEEESLRELQFLLLNVSLQAQSPDRWQWQSDPGRGYIVRDAYRLLTSYDSTPLDDSQ
ncbi:YIPF1-like protein, partial [Trifolium medium]|nr:YIPF1-like protein [Trifolium medium]